MRSARPKLVPLLMAMLILVGTLSQAFASTFCATTACPKKAAQDLKPKSCCPEQSEDKSNCCCSLESDSDAVLKGTSVAWSAPITLAFHRAEISLTQTAAPTISTRIHAHSDLPPPSAPIDRDRGRAPPVA